MVAREACLVLSICTVSSLRELVVPMDDYDFIFSNPVEGRVLRKKFIKKNVALRPTINSRCFGTLPDFGVRVSLRLKEADKIKRCFICTRRGALRAR